MENNAIKSIIEHFYFWEENTPDVIFLRQPYGNQWRTLTFKEAGLEARKMVSALKKEGLQKGDHIGIYSKNCYHWILADLAIHMGGFVSVPYYASLPKEQLKTVIGLSDLKALFVGKLDEWGSKAEILPEDLKVIRFPHYKDNAKVVTGWDWDELIKENQPMEGNYIPDLEDLWTILFTSGTTGLPKGVMHIHRSPALIMHNERETSWTGLFNIKNSRFFSYLPLNHAGERIGVETTAITVGGSISFVESIETFAKNLRETQPTLFFGVPRIWNKFYLGIVGKIPKRQLDLYLKVPIVKTIVKNKILKGLGLNQCKIAATGAAITPAFLKEFYKKLDLHLVEAYGMTEVCGSITNLVDLNSPYDSVGKVVPFAEIKIDPEDGEVIIKTPYMMTGYYNDPEMTNAVLKDNWMYSGDVGHITEDGFVKITGRKSDAFKTSKGKYIVPNPIEETILENDFIEQVCVVGLGLPNPIALVQLSEIGTNSSKESVERSCGDTLQNLNNELSNYEKIKTMVIITKDVWSEKNNLLTPTLKIKRNEIHKSYSQHYLSWFNQGNKIIWDV